jgi:hypothetical protein
MMSEGESARVALELSRYVFVQPLSANAWRELAVRERVLELARSELIPAHLRERGLELDDELPCSQTTRFVKYDVDEFDDTQHERPATADDAELAIVIWHFHVRSLNGS